MYGVVAPLSTKDVVTISAVSQSFDWRNDRHVCPAAPSPRDEGVVRNGMATMSETHGHHTTRSWGERGRELLSRRDTQ